MEYSEGLETPDEDAVADQLNGIPMQAGAQGTEGFLWTGKCEQREGSGYMTETDCLHLKY